MNQKVSKRSSKIREEETDGDIFKSIRIGIAPPSTNPRPPGSHGIIENINPTTHNTKANVNGEVKWSALNKR